MLPRPGMELDMSLRGQRKTQTGFRTGSVSSWCCFLVCPADGALGWQVRCTQLTMIQKSQHVKSRKGWVGALWLFIIQTSHLWNRIEPQWHKNRLTFAETVTSETTEKMREEREANNIIKFTCEWLGDDDRWPQRFLYLAFSVGLVNIQREKAHGMPRQRTYQVWCRYLAQCNVGVR